MHIVQYYHRPLPVKEYGGTERVVVWLIKGLKELGHSVTLIGPEGSSVDCDLVSFPKAAEIPDAAELKAYIPEGADVLHVYHNGHIDLDAGIPVLKTIEGYGNIITDKQRLDATYCFVSDAHRRKCQHPDNPFVYNGLDAADFKFQDNKDDYFLFLSRIDWKVKGLDWAIEVAKKADVKLIIAGNAHRKSFVNSYWRGFLKKHLNYKCLYVGPVGGELKAALLAGAKAMIFPTLWEEPFGIVAIEALVSGTPLITTHNGAMPEIVEHGKQGFLCRNMNEMIDAVRDIGSIRPIDCLNRVKEKFTYKQMAEEYVKLYERLLGKS